MHTRSKLLAGILSALLALSAMACTVEDFEGDPLEDDPLLEDGGVDDGFDDGFDDDM